tara:strand:+ start:4716 stop:6059 length:1344 start_codon:yes stop_codon:yes gene_type:complete
LNEHAYSTTAPLSLTGNLVRLIREKPITDADLDQAAFFTLDAVANILAGRNSDPGRILLDWWCATAPSNVAPEPGRMAFLMAALCHILETDDLHRASVAHPGCVVVPAAWTLAAKRGMRGKALLTAILHGFEAMTRVGMAVGAAHYRIWHNTATCGPFGAAMAAGNLLALTDEAAMNALGNAGSQSSGLWQFLDTGAMTKHLHAGHAAEAGIRAAELAAFGFTGPPEILEGDKGFFRATCPDADPPAVMRDSNAPWQLTLTSIKPWPCCRHTHPAIDAAEELRARLLADNIDCDRIAGVDVSTYRAALDVCDRPVVTSDYEAKFSLQHTVAASLLLSRVDFSAFGAEARARCAPLAARIRVETADPWASAYPRSWGGRVRLRLEDGTEYAVERTDAKGDPEASLKRDEMIEKADMLLRHGNVDEPRRLIDAILALALDGALPDLGVI